MATLTEDFNDNSLDTSLWNVVRSSTPGTTAVAEQNQQLEIFCQDSPDKEGGIISDITYDMTAPASIAADLIVRDHEAWVYASVQQPADGGADFPFFRADDWYRAGSIAAGGSASDSIWQVNEADSLTTLGSFGDGSSPGTNYKIELAETGDDVRFVVDSSEVDSDATYRHSTRALYCGLQGFPETGQNDTHFDNLVIVYTVAGGFVLYPNPRYALTGGLQSLDGGIS